MVGRYMISSREVEYTKSFGTIQTSEILSTLLTNSFYSMRKIRPKSNDVPFNIFLLYLNFYKQPFLPSNTIEFCIIYDPENPWSYYEMQEHGLTADRVSKASQAQAAELQVSLGTFTSWGIQRQISCV